MLQKTHSISITKTNQLLLLKEITAVCSQNHMKPTYIVCEPSADFLNVKAAVTYNNRCTSKD
jgi:hypothetical protein